MQIGIKAKFAFAGALIGLVLSFAISPTLTECNLFSACHESNLAYGFVAIFSSDMQSAIANEVAQIKIGHALIYIAAFSLLGFVVGAFVSQNYNTVQPAQAVQGSREPSFRPMRERVGVRSCELQGTGAFEEYYVKIDCAELRDMRDGFVIGRDHDHAGFAIDDDAISRAHARLSLSSDQFVLEDIGSTNSTDINGRKLAGGERKVLRSGDRVTFGAAQFLVTLE